MRTIKQIQSARANGAKSRGPITQAGKARSAFNALTHGLTAKTAVLSNESLDRFEALLAALIETYQPATQAEFLCVEEMAWAKWRMRRAIGLETTMLDDATAAQDPALNEATRASLAYQDLSRDSAGFRNIRRHETTHHRTYFRALQELIFLQASRGVHRHNEGPAFVQNEPEIIEAEVEQ